jgi:hypothetical protein
MTYPPSESLSLLLPPVNFQVPLRKNDLTLKPAPAHRFGQVASQLQTGLLFTLGLHTGQ